jgi:hypothetical protein
LTLTNTRRQQEVSTADSVTGQKESRAATKQQGPKRLVAVSEERRGNGYGRGFIRALQQQDSLKITFRI